MGVYNPNGRMPANCYDCYLETEADCDISKGIASASDYKDKRYEHCPLRECDELRFEVSQSVLDKMMKALENGIINGKGESK